MQIVLFRKRDSIEGPKFVYLCVANLRETAFHASEISHALKLAPCSVKRLQETELLSAGCEKFGAYLEVQRLHNFWDVFRLKLITDVWPRVDEQAPAHELFDQYCDELCITLECASDANGLVECSFIDSACQEAAGLLDAQYPQFSGGIRMLARLSGTVFLNLLHLFELEVPLDLVFAKGQILYGTTSASTRTPLAII